MKQPDNRTARGKAGAFEESFPEIVNFIDKNYRTIKKKSGRAIAGLSMGGGHTLQISKEYPDMFDYVGLFSSSVRMSSNNAASPVYENILEKLKVQFAKKPKLYWIAIGKDDFLYKANAEFRKVLDENGLKYEYFENGDGRFVLDNKLSYEKLGEEGAEVSADAVENENYAIVSELFFVRWFRDFSSIMPVDGWAKCGIL